jgi:hypothetical protein
VSASETSISSSMVSDIFASLITNNISLFFLTSTSSEKQTVEYNMRARAEFWNKTRAQMGIWEAMEMLDTLVDESDPDVRKFS